MERLVVELVAVCAFIVMLLLTAAFLLILGVAIGQIVPGLASIELSSWLGVGVLIATGGAAWRMWQAVRDEPHVRMPQLSELEPVELVVPGVEGTRRVRWNGQCWVDGPEAELDRRLWLGQACASREDSGGHRNGTAAVSDPAVTGPHASCS